MVPGASPARLLYDGDDYPSRDGIECLNYRHLSRTRLFGTVPDAP